MKLNYDRKMDTIEKILQEAHLNKWPYPKTFEALKAIGVRSYTVQLTSKYRAVFEGTFGKWEQKELQNYQPLITAEQFSSKAVKEAIINHSKNKTHYMDFLKDIAKAGVSHYSVNMQTREIRYYNVDETDYHQELVPLV